MFGYSQIQKQLRSIEGKLDKMAISQQQFDTDLATLITLIGTLIAAVDALPKPGTPDFTPEDQQVQTAAANVTAEIAKLQNPPPPAP